MENRPRGNSRAIFAVLCWFMLGHIYMYMYVGFLVSHGSSSPKLSLHHLGVVHVDTCMKTVTLSWLQNDGTRGFSKDQLKGKQLSPMFRPDALVVFRASYMYIYLYMWLHVHTYTCKDHEVTPIYWDATNWSTSVQLHWCAHVLCGCLVFQIPLPLPVTSAHSMCIPSPTPPPLSLPFLILSHIPDLSCILQAFGVLLARQECSRVLCEGQWSLFVYLMMYHFAHQN